ncbi:hypothetical protein BH18ACI4_BH18ACI4_21060 [soil metagenome]
MSWFVASPAEVDATNQLALKQALIATMPPRDEPRGVRECHLRHPDGHTFRVSSGIEEEWKSYPRVRRFKSRQLIGWRCSLIDCRDGRWPATCRLRVGMLPRNPVRRPTRKRAARRQRRFV